MAEPSGARVDDVARLCEALPEVTRRGTAELPSWSVGGKAFVFFREPRSDALDAAGERLTDVICLRTHGDDDKRALVDDASNSFFTTPHFNGYAAVLVRASHLDQLDVDLLEDVICEAWLSRAPKKVARAFLNDNAFLNDHPPQG